MDRFGAATRAWFLGAFRGPTPAQSGAWDAISSGRHALVVAPTGSGKTLAAFLWSLDRLLTHDAGGLPATSDAPAAAVAVAGVAKGRPAVLVATNAAAREAGVKAGALVRTAAGILGGGGGGKDDVAQGGGTDPAKIVEALGAIATAVAQR